MDLKRKIERLFCLFDKITCGDKRRSKKITFSVMANQAQNAAEFEVMVDAMIRELEK